MGTGKEQSIRITASSGLSEQEIQNLIKDAEMHAEEDKKKRDLAEARNNADGLVYTTEKSLAEFSDKLDAASKSELENALAKVKKEMEGNDPEAIKAATDELTKASHKLAEMIYAQAASSGAQQGPEAGPGPEGEPGQAGKGPKSDGGDDVVDADFEEVKK